MCAMEVGTIHERRDETVEIIDRGGWVVGVAISFVLAMSNGDRRSPAIPEADTESIKEVRGDGDERISSRAKVEGEGNAVIATVGSGSAKTAQKNDLKKDVIVERMTEYQNVLFVPFHTPQAPSVDHNEDNAVVRDDVDGRALVCILCCVEIRDLLDVVECLDLDLEEEYRRLC